MTDKEICAIVVGGIIGCVVTNMGYFLIILIYEWASNKTGGSRWH